MARETKTRKTKYETNVLPKLKVIEGWARDGLTDEQIAHNVGVSLSTYYEYKKKHLEFSDALKNGKDDIDVQVENALLKSALEGNTTAQIFWLKNRRSAAWRDKQEVENSFKGADFVLTVEATDDEADT